jgi:site-specific recombinase XerD
LLTESDIRDFVGYVANETNKWGLAGNAYSQKSNSHKGSSLLRNRQANGREELWLTEEGKPLSPAAVQCMIKRLKERAGVVSSGNIHRFRHTFALNFLRWTKTY